MLSFFPRFELNCHLKRTGDERSDRITITEQKMSGSSLGLRSASYGSLQQQLQNGAGLAQLQIQISPLSVPVSVRKTPSKMALQGSRDKERVLNRICKVAGRRRVGMFLLLLVSAVVFCSLFSFITKG